MKSIAACILAAGKGTRMKSGRPKVMYTVLGKPMLAHVMTAVEKALSCPIVTVIGYKADVVRSAFQERDGFVVQEEQLGTGHALQVAWDSIEETGASHVLVINGDTPLIQPESIEALAARTDADIAFLSITPPAPNAFGRVVRGVQGNVEAIVEAKDYDVSVHGPESGEVNAGIYMLRLESVKPLLGTLKNENKSGEYYITDLVGFGVSSGLVVDAVNCGDDVSLMGINSPAELIQSEQAMRKSIVQQHIERGVLIHNPETVIIGPDVEIEPGAEIFGHCELYGKTTVANETVLNSYSYIVDSVIERGAVIKQFCHLEKAAVGLESIVGPYARLRPGAELVQNNRVGNFVEIKKASLGAGSKANHLTYLGDAQIGEGCNIGAGTITCNYDGKNKFVTVIRDGAFIGSNTALVAPVTVGKNALVGAGSTITKDIPDESTGIARGKQINLARSLKRS